MSCEFGQEVVDSDRLIQDAKNNNGAVYKRLIELSRENQSLKSQLRELEKFKQLKEILKSLV